MSPEPLELFKTCFESGLYYGVELSATAFFSGILAGIFIRIANWIGSLF